MVEVVAGLADQAGVAFGLLVALLAKFAFGALPSFVGLDPVIFLDIVIGLGDTEVVVALLAG
jgi:hypothetical protein